MAATKTRAGGAEAVAELKRELAPVFQNSSGFMILGHGTVREAAESALKSGLRAKIPSLETTTVFLVDKEKRESGTTAGYAELLNWPHKGLKAVVVIKIPKEATSRERRKNNRRSLDEHLWIHGHEKDTADSANWVLPPKYIAGYVDVERLRFVKNPLFEQNPALPGPLPPRPVPEWVKGLDGKGRKLAEG
ncbi:MAG: hypothetical protein PHF51_00340 [Candidatus ainarchaeum sp.]|nr:hypothetical protein [Candidatus ainarchaeum sp.]